MLTDPYDPELFRRSGHKVVDALAVYLHSALAGELPVLPHQAPLELAQEYQDSLPLDSACDADAEVLRCLAQIIRQSIHLHHPGYVGHQVPPALPVAALADLISSLLNNSVAVYEMAQAGTQIERQVIRWLFASIMSSPRHSSQCSLASSTPPVLIRTDTCASKQTCRAHLQVGSINPMFQSGKMG